MTGESIATLIAGLVGGAVGKSLIEWWRFKDKDLSEASKNIHDSQSSALTVSSGLLEQWIKAASLAQEKIADLQGMLVDKNTTIAQITAQAREAEHASALCREALERCKARHGCQDAAEET